MPLQKNSFYFSLVKPHNSLVGDMDGRIRINDLPLTLQQMRSIIRGSDCLQSILQQMISSSSSFLAPRVFLCECLPPIHPIFSSIGAYPKYVTLTTISRETYIYPQ